MGPRPVAHPRKPSPTVGIVALVLAVLGCLPTLLSVGVGVAVMILLAVPALVCSLIALFGNRGRVFGLIALVLVLLPIGRIVLGLVN